MAQRTELGGGWSKSSRSNGSGGNCVAVRVEGDAVRVAHSRQLGGSSVVFSREEIAAFIEGAKAGEFDDLM